MKKKISCKLSILLVVLILLSLLSGCAGKESESLRLGLVSPLTGSGAAYGATQENAVKLAVNEINSNGGINGKIIIELISEDDENTPAKSVTVTQKLVNQNDIHVMIGALASTSTLADMQVTEKAGVPQIAPSSTALSITQQGNEWIFRNAASDILQTSQLFEYAINNFDMKKCAILNEVTDYGNGGMNLLKELANKNNIEIVAAESYNVGDKDFSVQLTKIKAADPDVIFIWGYYTEGSLIANQAKQVGLNVQMMGGTGFASPKFVELGADNVNGFIFSTPFITANEDPIVKKFVDAYRKAYNSEPDMNASQAYDAVYIMAEAVKKSESLDRTEIRDALRETNYQGVSGLTSFDETGEVIKNILLVEIRDSKYNILK